MEVNGDVLITEGEIGGNIQYKDGQPVMDAGMESFIYISLFSNAYWGNEITDDNSEKLSEGLDVFSDSKVTSQTRNAIIDRVNNLLQPMIDVGLADTIEVDVFLDIEKITLTILILKNQVVNKYKYSVNWNNQLNNPASARL